MTVLVWFLRAAAIAAGGFLIYGAALLTESEEGQLENRMQLLWERLTAAGSVAVNRHLSFARKLAITAGAVFDRAYESKLISSHAIVTSLILCASSAVAIAVTVVLTPLGADLLTWQNPVRMVAEFLAVSTTCVIALLPILAILGRTGRVVLAAVLCAGIVYLAVTDNDWNIVAIVGAAVLLDVWVVALVRWLIRVAARAQSMFAFLGLVLVSAASGLFVVVTPAFAAEAVFGGGGGYLPGLGEFFAAIAFTAVTAAPPLLLALMGISLLLHRIVWPTILRPLYSFKRHRVLFAHRKSTIGIGAYLILAGVNPATVGPQEVLRAMLKYFGVSMP